MRSQGRTGSTSVGEKVGEAHYDEVKCLWEEETGKDLKTRGKQKRRKKERTVVVWSNKEEIGGGGVGKFLHPQHGPLISLLEHPALPNTKGARNPDPFLPRPSASDASHLGLDSAREPYPHAVW